jgi:hypothetical protein
MTLAPSVTSDRRPGALSSRAVGLAVAPILLASLTSTWAIVKPFGGMLALSDYLLVLSLLITVPIVVLRKLPFGVPGWIFIPGLVIPVCVLARQLDPPVLSWRVLRVQIQEDSRDSFEMALIWLAALYVVPLAIIAAAAIERRAIDWVMGAYVSGVAISCAVATTDMLRLTHIASYLNQHREVANPLDYRWGERQAGLSDHPNMLGMVCVISLPFVIYFMSRKRRTWVSGVAFVAIYGGLLASGSRGAQAISLVTILVSVLCLPNKRTTIRTLSISVSIMIAAGVVLLSTVLAEYRRWFLRFTGGGQPYEAQSSNENRLGLLGQAWADFQRYPVFGAGIRHIGEAHNIYLQLLAAGGALLAAGMLAYLFCIIRDCWGLSNRGIVLARVLLISVGTWLVLGMIQNQLVDRELYFTVGCVAALVVTTGSPPRLE